ncbi:MAG TPA: AMP-binding protein, partial [Candidatus Thermoplasmatota archaeon]
FNHPLYILFSSGTTGTPKAIPWTHLTPIKCAMDGHFHQDIHTGDVVAWPTNIGWMMGPWLIYATLVNGATIALHTGAPNTRDFCLFVEEARVTMLGVVPALVRAWRSQEATRGLDWSGLRCFSSTGEASNQEDYLWLMAQTGYQAPVIEYCGGTEIGGGHITGTLVQPASPATFTTPALGLDFVILDDDGRLVPEGEMGTLYLVPPSVGLSERLLNRDHDEEYYNGAPRGPSGEVLRRHGDAVLRLGKGFYRAEGRADDTMNLGGIKVSSAELERVVDADPAVAQSAAVGVPPPSGGAEELVLFIVPRERIDDPGRLRMRLQERISQELNPLFRVRDIVPIDALPRTASNKVMRRELRRAYREDQA